VQGCIYEKSYKKINIQKQYLIYIKLKKTTDKSYLSKHKPKIYLKQYIQMMHYFLKKILKK